MPADEDIFLVLRFPDVAISQSSLEALLGRKMDRFEPPSGTAKGYAQLDIPDQHGAWSMLTVLASDLGSAVTDAVLRGDLGRPFVDVAYFFLDTHVTGSLLLPNAAVAAMGVAGFDVCISVYRTAVDE